MAKVLLVEDDNNLREIYEARLQAEGYVIVSAHDGEEALVVAKNEKPDLIISDVMMPKISGFEMLDILRNTEGLQNVKVIMLTALGQSDDQQRANSLGANRYLVKSRVTLEDIVQVAQELLTPSGDGSQSAAALDGAATTQNDQQQVATTTTPAPDDASVVAADEQVEMPFAQPQPTVVEPQTPSIVKQATSSEPAVKTEDVIPAPTAAQSSNDTLISNAVDSLVAESEPDSSDEKALPDLSANTIPPEPQSVSSASEPDLAMPTMAEIKEVSNDAETEAQEESTVQAQIENFAKSDVVATEPEAAPVASNVEQPVVTTTMPAALSSLDASQTTPAAQETTPQVHIQVTSAVEPKPEETVETPTPMHPKTEGGVKVIEPLPAAADKPDLNELLAKEEAMQSAEQVVQEAVPATSQTTASPTQDVVDPNSIAL